MRKPRLKAPPNYPVAYYHCLSRVVDRQFVLGEEEKEKFVSFMREYERFCGVRIITYCLMSNHFHILLEVPEKPAVGLTDQELVKRLKGLSGMNNAGTIEQQLGWFRERGQEEAAEALKQRVMERMWDVSAFMKLLKQRFTQWYNRIHGRKGTLWEERFKSVLVEGAGDVMAAMAAYIDLNPERANVVEDPKDYRWCGYAEALSGGKAATAGIQMAMRAASGREMNAREALKAYRMLLYGQGEATEGITETGRAIRKGFSREAVLRVVEEEKGRLVLADYLRLRVRYFADGAVLGTKNFVNEVYASMKERFGPKRKDGARRMRGVQVALYSLRDLRVKPLG
jgi:REP element-mobilizing transposase RayT